MDPSVTELRFSFSSTDQWIFLTIQTNRHPFFTGTCNPRPLFIFYYFVFLQMTLFPRFKPFYPVYMSAYLWTLSSWDDHPRKTKLTDKQTYKPGYAGTTKRKRTELASVI